MSTGGPIRPAMGSRAAKGQEYGDGPLAGGAFLLPDFGHASA
jgi:hypothetical protein